MLQRVADPVRQSESADIQTSSLITRIASDESSPTIMLTISAETGTRIITADAVVVTSPLGWLKRNHSAIFSPPLPERIARAIDNMTVANLEKAFITFPSVWWRRPELKSESVRIRARAAACILRLASPTLLDEPDPRQRRNLGPVHDSKRAPHAHLLHVPACLHGSGTAHPQAPSGREIRPLARFLQTLHRDTTRLQRPKQRLRAQRNTGDRVGCR